MHASDARIGAKESFLDLTEIRPRMTEIREGEDW
jgi:hypothetical protein